MIENIIQDSRLSSKAVGILLRALSCPKGTRLTPKWIEQTFPEGMKSLRNGLRELTGLGYVTMVRRQNEKKGCEAIWEAFSTPGHKPKEKWEECEQHPSRSQALNNSLIPAGLKPTSALVKVEPLQDSENSDVFVEGNGLRVKENSKENDKWRSGERGVKNPDLSKKGTDVTDSQKVEQKIRRRWQRDIQSLRNVFESNAGVGSKECTKEEFWKFVDGNGLFTIEHQRPDIYKTWKKNNWKIYYKGRMVKIFDWKKVITALHKKLLKK